MLMEVRISTCSKEAMKQLKALGGVPESPAQSAATPSKGKAMGKVSVTDCCICEYALIFRNVKWVLIVARSG